MLGEKERGSVKLWSGDVLSEVKANINTLHKINDAYAERILQILSYPLNKGNISYTRSIRDTAKSLGIPSHYRDGLYRYQGGKLHLGKVINQVVKAPNVGAIFMTNPILRNLEQEKYQELTNRFGSKDIDGQSTSNKMAIKDLTATLQGHIVHPTALSVLFLLQKILGSNIAGKTILMAGKNGNFGSMIAPVLERAGAIVIGFNGNDSEETWHENIKKSDAFVSVIPVANHFKQSHFEGFDGPIIDVTTANHEGKTVGSVDIVNCVGMKNIYIPSINGGVGTMTTAQLFKNWIRTIINTEIQNGKDPKIFDDLWEMINYSDFGLNREILA